MAYLDFAFYKHKVDEPCQSFHVFGSNKKRNIYIYILHINYRLIIV